jgi:hypothetical protein
MTDPRLVEPQRVAAAAEQGCAEHTYWCWRRISGAAVLGALVLALAAAIGWWVR